MTTDRDQDRTIFAWLSDGPAELADRVLDAALEEIYLTRQQPRPGRLWRIQRMTSLRTWVAAAAAVTIVAVGGAALLLRPSGSSGVAANASPSSSAPTVAGGGGPSPSAGCERVLGAGFSLGGTAAEPGCRYRSNVYGTSVTFGSTTGTWLLVIDQPRYLQLNARNTAQDADNLVGLGIATFDGLQIQPCQPVDATSPVTVPLSSVASGQGPSDLFAWLRANDVAFSAPKPVAIGGAVGLDAIVTVSGNGSDSCQRFGRWRLIVLDVSHTTITIEAWAPPDRLAKFQPLEDDLLRGLRFG